MALTWHLTRQDTLRIQDRAGGVVMWICGGLLLLFGGKLGWWLLLALGGMMQALSQGDWGQLGASLFGALLLTVMTAAFLLPGLWLLFGRSVVEIDPARGRITEMRDYVLWRRTKPHEIAEVAGVRGTHEVSRKSSSGSGSRSGSSPVQSYRLDVLMKGDGVREFLAAQPETKEKARELGHLMAAKLGATFRDLTEEFDSYGEVLRQRQGLDAEGRYPDESEENS